MTVTRQHLAVALACAGLGSVIGAAIGVLIGGFTPDVIVVFIAFVVLAVWSVAAGYLGWRVAMDDIANRLDQLVQTAVALDREGEQVRLAEALAAQRAQFEAQLAADEDALIEATKEDR